MYNQKGTYLHRLGYNFYKQATCLLLKIIFFYKLQTCKL